MVDRIAVEFDGEQEKHRAQEALLRHGAYAVVEQPGPVLVVHVPESRDALQEITAYLAAAGIRCLAWEVVE